MYQALYDTSSRWPMPCLVTVPQRLARSYLKHLLLLHCTGRPAEALQPGEHGCRCCSGGGNGVDPLTALAPSLECTLEADRGGCSEQCLEPPPHSDQLQSGTPQHCPGSDVAAAAAAAAAAADATATISLSSLHLHKAAQGKTVEATKNLDQRQQQHGQDREEGELAGKDMERSRGRDSGRGERVVVSSGGKGRATAGAHEGRYSCWGSVGRARAPKQQQQQKGAGVGVGVAEGRGMGQQGGVSLAEQQELQATMLLHYL